MEIAGYIAAVFIGIVLGMMGGGGSILTVPVLVYLFHVDPVTATTYSLFIVGVTSMTGGTRAYTKKQVDFKAVSEFGIPSIFSIFITRHYILPAIPEYLFSIGNIDFTRGTLLMVVFALLMLVASAFMILDTDQDKDPREVARERNGGILPLALWGLGIGFITGLLGAGGGFLIIPALVLFVKLPMKTAIGTSLVIIAINSIFGFLFSLKQTYLDWKILLLFTGLSIVGIYLGSLWAEKIPGKTLKKWFGWFVVVMGIYIIVKELVLR
ncbi:MAG TPA: sulfite exporter TauE/SafE family protein [Chitinophagaceae bacterium]|nr:sulfite exporter TauE/SafE family protein [Chitinophagaceae bacterium]